MDRHLSTPSELRPAEDSKQHVIFIAQNITLYDTVHESDGPGDGTNNREKHVTKTIEDTYPEAVLQSFLGIPNLTRVIGRMS